MTELILTALLLGAPSSELLAEHPEVSDFPEVVEHCLKGGTEWIEPAPENGGMGSAECYSTWLEMQPIVERANQPQQRPKP